MAAEKRIVGVKTKFRSKFSGMALQLKMVKDKVQVKLFKMSSPLNMEEPY